MNNYIHPNDEELYTILDFVKISGHYNMINQLSIQENDLQKDFSLIYQSQNYSKYLSKNTAKTERKTKKIKESGFKDFQDEKLISQLTRVQDKINEICNKPIEVFMKYIEDLVGSDPKRLEIFDKVGKSKGHMDILANNRFFSKQAESIKSENEVFYQSKNPDFLENNKQIESDGNINEFNVFVAGVQNTGIITNKLNHCSLTKMLEEELQMNESIEFVTKFTDFPYVYDFKIKDRSTPDGKETIVMVLFYLILKIQVRNQDAKILGVPNLTNYDYQSSIVLAKFKGYKVIELLPTNISLKCKQQSPSPQGRSSSPYY